VLVTHNFFPFIYFYLFAYYVLMTPLWEFIEDPKPGQESDSKGRRWTCWKIDGASTLDKVNKGILQSQYNCHLAIPLHSYTEDTSDFPRCCCSVERIPGCPAEIQTGKLRVQGGALTTYWEPAHHLSGNIGRYHRPGYRYITWRRFFILPMQRPAVRFTNVVMEYGS
jgi:hypothetical protein